MDRSRSALDGLSAEGHRDGGLVGVGQRALGLLRRPDRRAEGRPVGVGDAHPLQEELGQRLVEVVAAEVGVARRGQHLEDAVVELEDGDVEGPAAEVVDRDLLPRLCLVEAVGQGGRGGLVEEPQHVEPREARRVPGGLPLGVVEVGRDGDHDPVGALEEALLGPRVQEPQDEGADLHGRDGVGAHPEAHHAVVIVQQVVAEEPRLIGNLVRRPAHEALDAREGGAARLACGRQGWPAHGLGHAVVAEANRRGDQGAVVVVEEHARRAAEHHRHQRVRRPEVDSTTAICRFLGAVSRRGSPPPRGPGRGSCRGSGAGRGRPGPRGETSRPRRGAQGAIDLGHQGVGQALGLCRGGTGVVGDLHLEVEDGLEEVRPSRGPPVLRRGFPSRRSGHGGGRP